MTNLTHACTRSLVVVRALPADFARLATQAAATGRHRLLAEPPLWLLAALRRLRPVLRVGPLTMVTGGPDVERILDDDAGYGVAHYGAVGKELIGEFVLGVDGPRHTALRGDLDARLNHIADDLQPWADDAATRILGEAVHAWVADPVAELAWRLPTAFVAERGLVAPMPDEPEEELAGRAAAVYAACFGNLGRDRGVAGRGRRAADALRTRGLSGEQIGLVVGAIPTVSETVTRVVPALHAEPTRWREVRRAAGTDDHARLWSYIAEALRFSPQAPGLVRADVREPQRVVFASTYAAMHDPARVTCPGQFRTDRPAGVYLHFGAGPHRCAGEQLAMVLLTAAVRAVALADA